MRPGESDRFPFLTALAGLLTACSPAPPLDNSPPASSPDAATADASADAPAGDVAAEAAAAAGPTCPDCDDDNVCTYDLCQPKGPTCQHIPLPATTTCATDEDNCTGQWCDGTGQCVVYSAGECG